LIPWLVGLGAVIVCGLSWYAWSLTSQLQSLENKRSKAKQDAMMGIKVLIDSYLDNQVDRSECLLRMRVLLDAHHADWLTTLELPRFDEISQAILAMPFRCPSVKRANRLMHRRDASMMLRDDNCYKYMRLSSSLSCGD